MDKFDFHHSRTNLPLVKDRVLGHQLEDCSQKSLPKRHNTTFGGSFLDFTNQDSFDEYKDVFKQVAKSPEDLLQGIEDVVM